MSIDLKVTSLGETPSVEGPYRAWHSKVVDGSGAEFTIEVRICYPAQSTLEGQLSRPLTPEEMERVAACWAEEKVRDAISVSRPIPPVIQLTSPAVAGIEAQLLLGRCGLI